MSRLLQVVNLKQPIDKSKKQVKDMQSRTPLVRPFNSKILTPTCKVSDASDLGLDSSPMKSTSSRLTAATSKCDGSISPIQSCFSESLHAL